MKLNKLDEYIKRYCHELYLSSKLALGGRIYQYGEVKALKDTISYLEIDCIFDVGANHGQYAQMLRRDVGYEGLILSFEPSPIVFESLRSKADRDAKWHAYNLALSNEAGTNEFNVMESDQCSSLNTPSQDNPAGLKDLNKVVETITVELETLDNIYPRLKQELQFSRPMLKLDTQGHDFLVCQGGLSVFSQMRAVQTELAIRKIYEESVSFDVIIKWFGETGFAPSSFFSNNRGHFPLLYELDGIFINERMTT